jgi:hypothetical protein
MSSDKQNELKRSLELYKSRNHDENTKVACADFITLINDCLGERSNEDQMIPVIETNIQQEITMNWEPRERFRAKYYSLDNDAKWQDKGTGYFSIVKLASG